MNAPLRFRDGGLDEGDWVANAFRAADADAPSTASKEALLSSLSLGGVVAAGTAAVAAGSASGGAMGGAAAGASGPATVGVKLGATSALVKWLVVGSVAVASVGIGAKVGLTPHNASPPMTSPAASISEPQSIRLQPALSLSSNEFTTAPETTATTATTPLPLAPSDSPVHPANVTKSVTESAAAAASSSGVEHTKTARVSQEIAALDSARSLLHAGRGNEAQDALRTYAKEFPDGVLGPEAQVLQVEALLAAGRTEEASVQAHALLNAAPTGPLSAHLRDLAARADGSH